MKESFKTVKALDVLLDFGKSPVIPVGRLARDSEQVYFEYDSQFLSSGLQISPYKLPLQAGTMSFSRGLFEGLPGVFNDSLPDGWGRLLLDRLLRSKGILPGEFSVLDRLAHVGYTGMGALQYEPDLTLESGTEQINLDDLNQQTKEILLGLPSEVLQELIHLNGSSAGARPKALVGYNILSGSLIHGTREIPEGYEHWIVKFGNSNDGTDAGAIEYVYNLMAKKAGLEIPECHLFPGKGNTGYFATKRFDRRPGGKKLHMLTACGLLHSDFRTPALDYEDLIRATLWLTKDLRQAQKIFQYAVFNVLAHNRDDHSKNFSFLMDEKGNWTVSPAYDLTFSSGPAGQQSMLVAGEGENPGILDLLKLAPLADYSEADARRVIERIQDVLSDWPSLAKKFEVSSENVQLISKRLGTHFN